MSSHSRSTDTSRPTDRSDEVEDEVHQDEPEDHPIGRWLHPADASSAILPTHDGNGAGKKKKRYTAALIDCGSGSIRAYIAEIKGNKQRLLDELQCPVDLTSSFRSGRLERREMDRVVDALTRILTAAKAYGTTHVRAVATSAWREALNADILLQRIQRDVGLSLEVIDSAEESRLYYEALRARFKENGDTLLGQTLMVDVGHGNTAVNLLEEEQLVHAFDDYFGSMRAYEVFRDLHDSLDFGFTIDRYTHGAVLRMLRRVPGANPGRLLVTGSEVREVRKRIVEARKVGTVTKRVLFDDPSSVSKRTLVLKEIVEWLETMIRLTPMERAKRCGTGVHEASRMLCGASFLRYLCEHTGNTQVEVPSITLRDGLLADLLPGSMGPFHLERDQLLAAARQLGETYAMDPAYADNTRNLAAQLFDQTQELHELDERRRTLLEFAALVHDVGAYVNIRDRHKHTLYIIQSASLSGLTVREKEIVALVARYHRRSAPRDSHSPFGQLPLADRVVVRTLAALLRLAYALDVDRTQRIKTVRCEWLPNKLLLHLDRRQIALERWSVEDKGGLFEEVFGLPIEVMARSDE